MSDSNDINILIGDIQKTLQKKDEIRAIYRSFKSREEPLLQKDLYAFMILSEIFTNFYTCIETAFVRISKFFENNVSRERWHKDLLEKMTLDIPGVRPRVLSGNLYLALEEFLRFRHFKRYYFEFNYDPKRMAYLESRFEETVDAVSAELCEFIEKLRLLQTKLGMAGDELPLERSPD